MQQQIQQFFILSFFQLIFVFCKLITIKYPILLVIIFISAPTLQRIFTLFVGAPDTPSAPRSEHSAPSLQSPRYCTAGYKVVLYRPLHHCIQRYVTAQKPLTYKAQARLSRGLLYMGVHGSAC